MDRKAMKIAFSCACGAGIGTMVALEVATIFWWVGLLAGGFAGAMVYGWREILRAIPPAFRAAWRVTFRKEVGEFLSYLAVQFVIFLEISIDFPLLIACGANDFAGLWSDLGRASWGWSCIIVVMMLFMSMMMAVEFYSEDKRVGKVKALAHYRVLTMAWLFPPAAAVMVPYYLFKYRKAIVRGLWRCVVAVPAVVMAVPIMVKAIGRGIVLTGKFFRRFAWEVFIRVHAEELFLVGVDSMLGTAVGFFAGSAIVGAICGAGFGYLNYQVVTKRWLIPAGYVVKK